MASAACSPSRQPRSAARAGAASLPFLTEHWPYKLDELLWLLELLAHLVRDGGAHLPPHLPHTAFLR